MADYIDSPGTLQVPPPYEFRNVTTRVFVVEADPSGLKAYCDKFLNGGGDPAWGSPYVFQPLAPFGYLVVANYPFMESMVEKYRRRGFNHQNEVYFAFPVVRYWKLGTLLLPTKLSFAVPFIAVDDPGSAICGQVLLGLNKLVGRFEFSRRDGSPAGPLDWQTFKVWVQGVHHFAPDSSEQQIKAIEIALGRDPKGSSADHFPFADWRTELHEQGPSATHPRATFNLRLDSIPEIPGPGVMSTVTLKQFRDPAEVDRALYQALVGFDTSLTLIDRPGADLESAAFDETEDETTIKVYKDNAMLKLQLAWALGSNIEEDGVKAVEFGPKLAYRFFADMTIDGFDTVHSETPTSPPPNGGEDVGLGRDATGFSWYFGPFAGEAKLGMRSTT